MAEIIQGKTTVAEASRAYGLLPYEVEDWVQEGKRGTENALRTKLLELREEYERQLKELQAAYGEAMLELRARNAAKSHAGGDSDPRTLRELLAHCAGSQPLHE